jgi:tetratricopeptide (TPR) repeat protein
MAFWKKLFGKSFEESVAAGEDLLAAGRAGEARLELEQALARSKGEPEARIEHVRGKIAEARDLLVKEYIEDGKAFASNGQLDNAQECFQSAKEIAVGDVAKAEIQLLIDGLDAQDAREAFDETDEMTETERFQVLSGAWEDERADELESYGEEFRKAFLELHAGEAERAAATMAEILEENPGAVYLHLELGLALRTAGRVHDAVTHIQTFLSLVEELGDQSEDDDEDEEDEEEEDDAGSEPVTPEAQVQAHVTLAEIFLELDDAAARAAEPEAIEDAETAEPEAKRRRPDRSGKEHGKKSTDYSASAERELRALLDLLPEQSSPYVHLGAFLRKAGRLDESLEVLEAGQPHLGSLRPDMRLVRELGLTHRALGNVEAAMAALKAVVEYSAATSDFDFDPSAAVPLAELHEEKGELARAADLYRHLAAGSHAAGHFSYNRNAGRLLAATKQPDLARKFFARAVELAPSDDQRREVEELIAKLES